MILKQIYGSVASNDPSIAYKSRFRIFYTYPKKSLVLEFKSATVIVRKSRAEIEKLLSIFIVI